MRHPKGEKAVLAICNVILIVIALWAVIMYSRTFTGQKNVLKRDTFCNTIESLKQVSQNYLSTEKGYADDWAAYIEAQHMTAEEALEYIRTTNTQDDRVAHLVNMKDMSARSTYVREGGNAWVHYYEEQSKLGISDSEKFINKMQEIFNAGSDKLPVLGKYRESASQRTVISVGTKVKIREADGTDQDYLLLRLIPVEYMQHAWVFPTEYTSAEVSLIARDGGYVVQSPSLRSSNFLEFIRGYNFQENYNQVNELAEQLLTTDKGMLRYKDSKGQECYFYYSSMGVDTDLDIMGYIPVSKIENESVDWIIALLVGGSILALMLMDGGYILVMNKKLRRAVQMEEKANMAKTQFLSSMSHDIRTPMNAVIGMTEIARHHLDDTEYVKDCLDKVATSGNHLLTLINDILDISKVESGKMTLNPVPFSVKEAVNEMYAMICHPAADKDIELILKMHDISQEFVMGDTLRLQQVMINLLTNAVKYTENGGHVVFEVSEEPALKEGYTGICFVVSDDGMGMSEEFQRTMYSSFSRETDSRINSIQGSGLGLAIVSQMVELMDGTIECDSRPEKGTTFTVRIELPITENKADSVLQSETTEEVEKFAGMYALVAEDNDLNWEIIHIMLEEQGILSDRAQNGQICLDMLEKKADKGYDLVFMDVQMPVMDGKEATRRLRKNRDSRIRNIPVVAMTADAFAEDVYACLEAGMDAHISKPVEMKRVLEIMQRVHNGTLHKEKN